MPNPTCMSTLDTSDSSMRTLANSEDPDENVAFHHSLHCLINPKTISKEKNTISFCDPTNYKMNHPKFMVSNPKEESIIGFDGNFV